MDFLSCMSRARRLGAALWCCVFMPVGAHAQIIEALPVPAQGIGAVQQTSVHAGLPIASRGLSSSASGSDIDRYAELTDIGAGPDKPASAAELAEAYQRFCQSAGHGSTDALLRLGWMHLNGIGVAQDDAIAGTLFRRAAAYGSELAGQFLLMVNTREEGLPECLGQQALAQVDVEPARLLSGQARDGTDLAHAGRAGPGRAPRRLAALVARLAGEFQLDPQLVLSLIRVESGFDPNAHSQRDAAGLMQLIPATAERFGVADRFDPTQNLRGGMAYLRWLLSYYRGNVTLALAAYNAGEGAVDRYRGVPPFAETRTYVRRIHSAYPHEQHSYNPRLASASPVVSTPAAERAARLQASNLTLQATALEN